MFAIVIENLGDVEGCNSILCNFKRFTHHKYNNNEVHRIVKVSTYVVLLLATVAMETISVVIVSL